MKIDSGAQQIIDELYKKGYEGYLVGGCVRDIIMGTTPKDWDIATNAKPIDVKKVFRKTIDTGIEHGTVTVRINKVSYEVTTYRIDGEYKDSRRPEEVFFTKQIELDLERRDFTINAMAYNEKEGLKDCFKGLDDIKDKIIRCVGNAEKRLEEDALRIMRGLRFSSQLGFDIEEKTLNAMIAKRELLRKISIERIREELDKMLCGKYPAKALQIMAETGVMEVIMPEMIECIGFKQWNPNHSKDVFMHTLDVIENSPDNRIVRTAALFHDIGKPKCFTKDEAGIGHFYGHEVISAEIAEKIMKRMKYDTKSVNKVKLIILEHMNLVCDFKKKSSIKRFIQRVGTENLKILFELKRADIMATTSPERLEIIERLENDCNRIIEEKEPYLLKDLAVNGNDLLKMGYKGREIGEILNKMLEIIIEHPEKNNFEELKQIVIEKKHTGN